MQFFDPLQPDRTFIFWDQIFSSSNSLDSNLVSEADWPSVYEQFSGLALPQQRRFKYSSSGEQIVAASDFSEVCFLIHTFYAVSAAVHWLMLCLMLCLWRLMPCCAGYNSRSFSCRRFQAACSVGCWHYIAVCRSPKVRLRTSDRLIPLGVAAVAQTCCQLGKPQFLCVRRVRRRPLRKLPQEHG